MKKSYGLLVLSASASLSALFEQAHYPSSMEKITTVIQHAPHYVQRGFSQAEREYVWYWAPTLYGQNDGAALLRLAQYLRSRKKEVTAAHRAAIDEALAMTDFYLDRLSEIQPAQLKIKPRQAQLPAQSQGFTIHDLD